MKFGIPWRRKKPWLRFFSLEPGLAENYPLIPTSSIKRTWQDKEHKESRCPFMGTQNVANCPGLKQITRMGYVVTAPMDFTIITNGCLLYTSPSPRDRQKSRMPSSA